MVKKLLLCLLVIEGGAAIFILLFFFCFSLCSFAERLLNYHGVLLAIQLPRGGKKWFLGTTCSSDYSIWLLAAFCVHFYCCLLFFLPLLLVYYRRHSTVEGRSRMGGVGSIKKGRTKRVINLMWFLSPVRRDRNFPLKPVALGINYYHGIV